MAKQTINIGSAANDDTGEGLRTGGDKINDNFNEVYGVSGVLKSNGSDTLSAETNLLYDNVVEAYTKQAGFTATSQTRSSTGTLTLDLDSNQVHILTAGANFTVDVSNQVAGNTYIIILKQDATGSRAVSWSSNFKFEGGTAPTQSTDASDVSIWSFASDGTYMYGTGLIDMA